jgi:uncharacterized repeat protein (TIGR03803 family)
MRSKTLAGKNRSRAIGWGRFGTLCLILAASAMVSLSQGQQAPAKMVTFTNLLNFDGTNGGIPAGPLVQGLDGDLYGTTYVGGASGNGTFFKITPGGTLTTIYNFCSQANCADGSSPTGGLTLGSDGNFYGITGSGGTTNSGIAFKITPSGALTILHNWCSLPNNADGCFRFEQEPNALVQGTDGNFYGTNDGGGTAGAGTFFKLTPTGTLTTIYTFCLQSACLDGSSPTGLIQAADGNFYGTAVNGGAFGDGTVFRITPTGTLTTVYSFCSQGDAGAGVCTDGALPFGALTQAADGNFYGTTSYGGANMNSPACTAEDGSLFCGTIFRITPSGKLTTIYNFCSQPNCTDGGSPLFRLVQATDGNLYGITGAGGAYSSCTFFGLFGCGTLFEITPWGKMTTLYSFDAKAERPNALFQATDGTFYGTTFAGGTSGTCGLPTCGTAFSLSVGLGPFVETVPTSGTAGQTVTILGTDLSGVTEVRFGLTQAEFQIVSATEIQATVPVYAATGYVTVHIPPFKTLISNVRFEVVCSGGAVC